MVLSIPVSLKGARGHWERSFHGIWCCWIRKAAILNIYRKYLGSPLASSLRPADAFWATWEDAVKGLGKKYYALLKYVRSSTSCCFSCVHSREWKLAVFFPPSVTPLSNHTLITCCKVFRAGYNCTNVSRSGYDWVYSRPWRVRSFEMIRIRISDPRLLGSW